MVVVMSTIGAASAFACPYSPVPTFKAMIRDGSTDVEGFPLLLLGHARAVRDLRGGPNGYAIARFRVAEDAIGRVPRLVRVRFYRPKPSDEDVITVTPYATLERGERWALVSRRRSDDVVRYEQICGPSRELGQERLRALVRYARRS